MKAYVIEHSRHYETDLPEDLSERVKRMYEIIGCDLFDHTYAILRDAACQPREYDLFVDDEGLLKPNTVNGVRLDNDGQLRQALAGTILVMGVEDEDGNDTPLTDEDIAIIRSHIVQLGRDDVDTCLIFE